MAFLRKKTTAHDELSMGHCYSAFQKCVRRGLTSNALYYGSVIRECGSLNVIKKRLIQFALEDFAWWEIAVDIFMKISDENYKKYIIVLCNSEKTHVTAYMQRIALETIIDSDFKTEIVPNEFEKAFPIVVKWYREFLVGNIRKLFGTSGNIENKIFTLMKEVLVFTCYILYKEKVLRRNVSNINDIDDQKYESKRLEPDLESGRPLPYWVYDKHVSNGVKGYKFFFEHGLVYDKKLFINDPYEKQARDLYIKIGKKTKVLIEEAKEKIEEEKRKENNSLEEIYLREKGFDRVLQIQLLTRRNTPKVFFCGMNGEDCVVKGPLTQRQMLTMKKIEIMKKDLSLPSFNIFFVEDERMYWAVTPCLLKNVDYEDFIFKESKLEQRRKIYNGVSCHIEVGNLTIEEWRYFILSQLFKTIVTCNDCPKRNFLVYGEKVFSIDDHVDFDQNKKITIVPRMKQIEIEEYKENFREQKNEILKILRNWREILEDPYKSRLDSVVKEIKENI